MAKAEYRSAIRSRHLIVTALTELLREKPLDKITVTDVVTRADINRGTFYAHYADIPDVINSIVNQYFQRIRQALDSQSHIAEEMPGILVRQIQLLLESDMDFVRTVMDSSAAPMLQEQLRDLALSYALAHLPVFPGVSEEDHILNLRFCAGGLSTLYRDWFTGRLALTPDQLTVQAERILRRVMLQNP